MNCNYCELEMKGRQATNRHPHHYKLSGLENMLLTGIEVFTCPKCGHEAPIIPRISQLHAEIANGLIHISRSLRGDEVRFLRKHIGLPAYKFARLIGVTHEHLSRIENGHVKNLGKPTDRLVRILTITAKKGRNAWTILLNIADDLANAKKNLRQEKVFYELDERRWRRQPA